MENNHIISSMASAFVESSGNPIGPPKVATIYRIASKTVLMPALKAKPLSEIVLACLDTAVFTAACLIQNNEQDPADQLLSHIERSYTPRQLTEVISNGLSGITVDQITTLYELDKKRDGSKHIPTKADSIIHRQIGSFMKHFGLGEHEVKFKMTWQNYLLYMNSIPPTNQGPQTDENGEEIFKDGKNRYPVKDASEVF